MNNPRAYDAANLGIIELAEHDIESTGAPEKLIDVLMMHCDTQSKTLAPESAFASARLCFPLGMLCDRDNNWHLHTEQDTPVVGYIWCTAYQILAYCGADSMTGFALSTAENKLRTEVQEFSDYARYRSGLA